MVCMPANGWCAENGAIVQCFTRLVVNIADSHRVRQPGSWQRLQHVPHIARTCVFGGEIGQELCRVAGGVEAEVQQPYVATSATLP